MKYSHITELASQRSLVLGSRSPRRVALLRELGIRFEQIIPFLEEEQKPGELPYDFAVRLARDKARLIAGQVDAGHVVIGCDTVVALANEVLQKPRDRQDAFAILSRLAGRKHVVCTALALAGQVDPTVSAYELTDVYFNPVTDERIRAYIDTGEPMDKAGAYGIQGMGAFLVDRIKGNLDNVIGLPRTLLDQLAARIIGA